MHHSLLRLRTLAVAAATAGVTALPAAAVTVARPHAVCTTVSAPARFAEPIYSDLPAIAAAEGLRGTTTVKIELADDGRVVAASVAAGSGAEILDAAALRLIRAARYVPETAGCAHVSGSYLADVEFGN